MIALPIQLPDGFSLRITQGSSVAVGDLLAESVNTQQDIQISIVEQLRISAAKARQTLIKIPGDHVTRGDVLAVLRGPFGISKAEVVSNVSGVITRYERSTGIVVIRTGSQSTLQKIFSPVAGVISLCNNEQIVVSTQKHAMQGKKGSGKTVEGEVLFLDAFFSDKTQGNLLYYLDSTTRGKIVVGNSFTREMLLKSVGIGIKGIIAGIVDESDLVYLSSRQEKIPVVSVGQDRVAALKQWDGKKVFLDGESKSIVFLQL